MSENATAALGHASKSSSATDISADAEALILLASPKEAIGTPKAGGPVACPVEVVASTASNASSVQDLLASMMSSPGLTTLSPSIRELFERAGGQATQLKSPEATYRPASQLLTGHRPSNVVGNLRV